MTVVDVRVYAEESLEDILHSLDEIRWKWHTWGAIRPENLGEFSQLGLAQWCIDGWTTMCDEWMGLGAA